MVLVTHRNNTADVARTVATTEHRMVSDVSVFDSSFIVSYVLASCVIMVTLTLGLLSHKDADQGI